jgi:hypothetical protein
VSGVQAGAAVYVVVEAYIDGHQAQHVVHGVYSTEKLARIAAFHPYGSLKVLRLWLDAEPVNESEIVEREDCS